MTIGSLTSLVPTKDVSSQLLVRADLTRRAIEAAGVDGVTFAGFGPTFRQPRLLVLPETAWVVVPADLEVGDGSSLPVPREQLRRLEQLVAAGVDFPHTYIAHETPRRLAVERWLADRGLRDRQGAHGPGADVAARTPVTTAISHEAALALIPKAPPVAATLELSNKLGNASGRISGVVKRALPVLAGIAVAPAAAVAAVAAGAVAGLDPVVFGVVSIDATQEAAGAWFALAQWVW